MFNSQMSEMMYTYIEREASNNKNKWDMLLITDESRKRNTQIFCNF